MVKYEADIPWLRQQLAALIPASPGNLNSLDYAERWKEHLRSRVRIVSLEDVRNKLGMGATTYGRLEGWTDGEMAALAP